jgi:beta-aspartyl-peptidase (threonine type)
MKPCIIVHGGAWDIPEDAWGAHHYGCLRAVREGYSSLQSGYSAVDAVETAVRVMEEDPTFDAGRGSFLNAEGEVEMDATIMDGDDLSFGAVAAVQNILHPVTLARQVMERTQHCMLVGEGALKFARSIGMPTVDQEFLLTERELRRWQEIKNNQSFEHKVLFNSTRDRYSPKGTVGAVAIDEKGKIAAATSTGGTPNKMAGRVGDSALIGCGNYADSKSAGVSATGWGEPLMKAVMARRVCNSIENGKTAEEAAEEAIRYLEERVKGYGGIIVIDREGNASFSHNTPRMAIAGIRMDGELFEHI